MNNRIALVTGASRGIGRACALALSEAGARVVLAARDVAKLEEVAALIRAAGREAHVVALDLALGSSIKEAFDSVTANVGPVEILVNNAGITRDGLAVRISREDWNSVIDTNLTGSFLCIQHVLRGMMRARWGRIVNITSVVGQTGNAGQVNYSASKAGLIGMTKSLAQELGSRNITVNAVAPGFIETDMTSVLSDELKGKMLGEIPLGRMGQVDDIAAAVRFLASDGAAYITGHVLSVNGGLYM
ncbi:MAG: 3-oxoacyl-[acyl-carrier-protein] reductase [Bryobacteraceae bacterium]|nr:3-oxoacyl-[acyl-carrier-protein] reductase [Bryobacteraceae bacterium]